MLPFRRIVVVVAVLVVDFEQLQIAMGKGAGTTSAHQGKSFSACARYPAARLLSVASGFKNYLVQPVVWFCHQVLALCHMPWPWSPD